MVLGFPHPDYLLDTLTSRQWQDWIEWASVEPVGDEREDWRVAFASAGLASCWADGVKVDSFKIDWLNQKPRLSLDDRLRCALEAHNVIEAAKHG